LPNPEQIQPFIILNLFTFEQLGGPLKLAYQQLQQGEEQLDQYLAQYQRDPVQRDAYQKLRNVEVQRRKLYPKNSLGVKIIMMIKLMVMIKKRVLPSLKLIPMMKTLLTRESPEQYPQTFCDYDIKDYYTFLQVHLLKQLIYHHKQVLEVMDKCHFGLPLMAVFLRHDISKNKAIQSNRDLISLKQHLPPRQQSTSDQFSEPILEPHQIACVEHWVHNLGNSISEYQSIPGSWLTGRYMFGLPQIFEQPYFFLGVALSSFLVNTAFTSINMSKVLTTYINTLTSHPTTSQVPPPSPLCLGNLSTLDNLFVQWFSTVLSYYNHADLKECASDFAHPDELDLLTNSRQSVKLKIIEHIYQVALSTESLRQRIQSGTVFNETTYQSIMASQIKEAFVIDNHLPDTFQFGKTTLLQEPPSTTIYHRYYTIPISKSE
jgi:hypothetical protein